MDKDNSPPNTRQQISDKIKGVSNILVTVSKNPTVDELSAALALTLILNKLDKHATAVFSGAIPPAIEFLEPDKTLENNVDSLRDFIIAIDKEKADRLRYKVEGDVVRIFITPYKTHITEQDLEFTHGDFNVELVLALNVENQDVLDEAITAHGKILHDATVATINTQGKTSTLGSIDWQDEGASSLCEMLVSLGESLKGGLLDEQIATTLLTGIVAATDRFSNKQTSSKSMTIAAQLMAAGANQQLIASKLENASEISVSGTVRPDGSVELDEGKSGKLRKEDKTDNQSTDSLGQIQVDHEKKIESGEDDQQSPLVQSTTIEEHDKINKQNAGEEALDAALEKLGTKTKPTVEPLEEELEKAAQPVAKPQKSPLIGQSKPSGAWNDPNIQEPSLGSSLSATIKEATEARQRDEESGRNRTILSHDGIGSPDKQEFNQTPIPETTPTVMDIQVTTNQPKVSNTLADVEANIGAHNQGLTSSNLGDTHQNTENTLGQSPSSTTGLDLPPVPVPPLPDFSTLPPLQPTTPIPSFETTTIPSIIPPPQKTPVLNEPGQFKIPGQ